MPLTAPTTRGTEVLTPRAAKIVYVLGTNADEVRVGPANGQWEATCLSDIHNLYHGALYMSVVSVPLVVEEPALAGCQPPCSSIRPL